MVCLLGLFACEKDEFVPFSDTDSTLTLPPATVATSIRQLSGKERKTLINQIMVGETGKSFAKSQVAYLDSTLSAPAMVVYDSLNDSDVYTFFLSKPATSLAKDPDMRDCCTRLLTSVGILTGPLQNEDEEYFQRIHEFSVAYGFNYGTLLQLIDRDELNACTTGIEFESLAHLITIED